MTSLVTEKAINKNVWQMPESSKYLQRNLVLVNGRLLVQVLKRSGTLQRIVHKELGIILRKKCYWNSQKAHILQTIVLSEIKAEVRLQNENPSHHQILWQQYEERIKSLSQESKVSKLCIEAGFVHIAEVRQYFMTTDTGDFRQFRSVACREYTLPRDDESSQPRGWIQGNTRIGPVLEVTTSYMYGKHGIKIRIWSVSQDNSQSWVRISYGTNKYVVDSNYNDTEVPADLPEEQASQSSVKVIAARSKEKEKPQKRNC